ARGNPELIRLYESRFADANKTGRTFLLGALRICGDQTTQRQIDKWLADATSAEQKRELSALRTFLADSKRQLPRDRTARTSADLLFLWLDFLVTGEYPPIARILDTLDQPDAIREKVQNSLKNEKERQELLEVLDALKLLAPATTDKLVPGD